MRISFTAVKGKLHRDMMVDFLMCPVGGHNYSGEVERRIKHSKESLKKAISNQRKQGFNHTQPIKTWKR